MPYKIFLPQGRSLCYRSSMPANLHTPNEGIELLHTPECRAWPEAEANLRAALAELNLDDEIHVVALYTLDEAREYNFFASPTIHVNGVDVEPQVRRSHKRGLGMDRPYFWNGASHQAPPIEFLKKHLEELL